MLSSRIITPSALMPQFVISNYFRIRLNRVNLLSKKCSRVLSVRSKMSGDAKDNMGPTKTSLVHLRVNYSNEPLNESTLTEDPFILFTKWIKEATEAGEIEPNAMCLATVDSNNRPSARMVLLKGFDHRGFVWYTNYTSRKAQHLQCNSYAALNFWWPNLQRSIRIEGTVHKVNEEEADAYFKSRPVQNQLGALASNQSADVETRLDLENKWNQLQSEYLNDSGQLIKTLDRPSFWGGYRLVPNHIEFWKGRPARLHDRILYQRKSEDIRNVWTMKRLQP